MTKIDLSPLEDITLEEIKIQLREYSKKGFKWRKRIRFWTEFSIDTPIYSRVDEDFLVGYFSVNHLKFGNYEQQILLNALHINRLLKTKEVLRGTYIPYP